MKKFVALLCFFSITVLCGCSVDTSGYKYELVSNVWEAELDGGAKAFLQFDGDIAVLELSNGGLERKIEGRYIADDNTLVIFVPELKYNYSFEYEPKGNTLELRYNAMTLLFNSAK